MEEADRISKLPDAILSHILSFLSTKEAVGTSILSTRWRYLFPLVSNLDFELVNRHFMSCKKRKISTIDDLVSFVERVLFIQNASSLEKFRLECGVYVDSSRVCGWISAAVWREIKHLDLNIYSISFTTLPAVLFTCKTLMTLKLEIDSLNVPNDVHLPNLRTLHLCQIRILNDDSVKRLLCGCFSLEDLIMESDWCDNISNFNISHNFLKRLTLVSDRKLGFRSIYSMVIDAPMLVYFKYVCNDYGATCYSLKNLQSLVCAEIDFYQFEDLLADPTPLFRGICNVQSLHLSASSLKLLLSCVPVLVFPNTVQLKISSNSYYPASGFNYYSREKGVADLLLSSFPELEKLSFCQEIFSDLPEEVTYCCLFKLKEIEISEVISGKHCIEMAKYFLENAGALKKLTIRMDKRSPEKEKLKITDELMSPPMKLKQRYILVV